MNLVERAKNILLTPKTEWEVIAQEPTSIGELYRSYVLLLAAIGPIASFIATFRWSFTGALARSITFYVLSLVVTYVVALIIDGFATTFGGEKNRVQAFKVAAYAYTAAWIAGVLMILPSLFILILLASLYGIYLVYLGLPVLMKAPADRALGYTIAVIVCAFVLGAVVQVVIGRVAGFGFGGSSFGSNTMELHSSSSASVNNPLGQMAAQVAAANQQMQAAQKSGDVQAQGQAAGNVIAAVLGGGPGYEPVDQNILKGMLPDTVNGMPRKSFEASKGGMGGIQVSKAEAHYANDQGTGVDLTITDLGGTKMLGVAAAWATVEEDKETDTGYEKTAKVDGRPTMEKFEKNGPRGEYSVLVGQRFVVEANGNVDIDTVKQAVGAVDLAKLDSMKDEGAKKIN